MMSFDSTAQVRSIEYDASSSAELIRQSSAHRPLVLHVRAMAGYGGGPEKTIINSPRYLRRFGYDAKCAYLHPPGDPGIQLLQLRANAVNADLNCIPDRGPFDWQVVRFLIQLCKKYNVAIWHAHGFKSNVLGLIVRRYWNMKLVTTVHGWVSIEGRNPLYSYIDRRLLRFYDRVICVSEDLYQEAISHGVRPSRCAIVHNAIETECDGEQASPDHGMDVDALPTDRDGFIIGAVGRLAPEKGFDLLIRACDRLLSEGHDLRLWIAGDGGEFGRLSDLIQFLGWPDRIRLLGHIQETRILYQAIDLFVLSSLREGLPNVVLEAMASGVPVLATKVAGVPSLIESGVNGTLIDSGSTDELANGIERMVADEPARKTFVDNAKQMIEQHFSFESRMKSIASNYDELLG